MLEQSYTVMGGYFDPVGALSLFKPSMDTEPALN